MTTENTQALPPDLTDLLAVWHGSIELTPERREELLARLEIDTSLRRQFAEEISLAGLTRAVQSGEPRWLRIEERLGLNAREADAMEERIMAALTANRPGGAKRTRLFFSAPIRSWSAAAAGLLIGLFSASIAWAMVSPRVVATASRLFALIDGSFEKTDGRVTSGFPSGFGQWSGDEAEVVSGKAIDGTKALHFGRAEGDVAVADSPANSCDVYQLVDLRSLKADAEGGEATLEMSAQFLDARSVKGTDVTFTCRLYVFSGSPESLRGEWPLTRKDALALGSGLVQSTGGTPQMWHSVTAKVLLPPQAEFAVVQLVAGKAPANDNQPAEFGDQFADDVRLTLKTQPTLPVRLGIR